MSKRSISGYTLSGLLSCLALIGVLAGLSVPSWLGFIQSRRVAYDAQQASAVLASARSEATTKKLALIALLKACQTDSECDAVKQIVFLFCPNTWVVHESVTSNRVDLIDILQMPGMCQESESPTSSIPFEEMSNGKTLSAYPDLTEEDADLSW